MAIESKEISKPSETKQDSPFKMEPSAITGVFAGYELCPGCKWNGICVIWSLGYFADMDISTKSPSLSRRHRRPHKTKVVDLPDEGMRFPLKSECDTAKFTLEGIRRNIPPSALDLPHPQRHG